MHCKHLRTFFSILWIACFMPALWAQSATCTYTLILNDTYGDGWNGGVMTIISGGNSTTYTLPNGFNDTVSVNITPGAPLTVSWVAGSFLTEVGFQLLDNVGNVLIEAIAPAMPLTGTIFTGIGACVSCAAPHLLAMENVWDTRARLRWSTGPNSPNPAVQYLVIYGLQGFDLAAGAGDTLTTSQLKITLTGLEKKTWYDVYVVQDCGVGGGYSAPAGPVSFQTYWTKDVGIAGVVAPVSGCDLGLDTVKVLLKNYGAAPQSLIPFRYTVNGEEVNIPKPADGFYTGVLGKDSSEVVFFETVYDFSEPGEYVIVAYTKFTGDEDISNDTFVYRFNNRLVSPYFQSFETWDGDWRTYAEDGSAGSWVYGAPDKTNIPAAYSGQNAWVTQLNSAYFPGELAYLESPCFDFTELAYDPALTFAIAYDIESNYDGAWLELSTDDGDTWQKIGAINEGINWYNEDVQNGTAVGESWSGSSNGWIQARHFLTGAAGESTVRFRFVLASDPSVQLDGLAIDDIRVFPAFSKDLAGVRVNVESEGLECGLEADRVTFTFANVGNVYQDGFKVAYSVNGGTPVLQNVGGSSLNPDEVRSLTFNVPFDSRDAVSVIKCWTVINGDFAPLNDTVTLVVNYLPKPVPFQENFESQQIPEGWNTEGFVTNGHGNTSYVLAVNLYSFNPEAIHELPRYGTIGADDTLTFSYRIVNFTGGGPTLIGSNTFVLQVSTDCGETYQTINSINSFNHTPTINLRTRKIPVGQFAGQAVKFRFLCTWASGDFWFDLDNINLLSCAADMALSAEIVPAVPGQSNGAATIQVGLGNPPYTYEWDNGATTQTVEGLASGPYAVTVTDALGCTDSFEFNLGTTAVGDIESLSAFHLAPNPTPGVLQIGAVFFEPQTTLQLEIVNLTGQTVWEATAANLNEWQTQVDLSGVPAGLYLVRLSADGKTVVKKLAKS